MQTKFLIGGAIALVVISAGVPSMMNPGDPAPPAVHNATFEVQVIPELGIVEAVLSMDPAHQVLEVEMWSQIDDLVFTEQGEGGVWVAEGPLLGEESDVHCYPVTARVTMATVQHSMPASVPVAQGKVKKAKKLKKVKTKKAEKAGDATRTAKVKKAKKLKKPKKVKSKGPSVVPGEPTSVMGAMVFEITASDCLAARCEELPN